jgi:hypothetical protein
MVARGAEIQSGGAPFSMGLKSYIAIWQGVSRNKFIPI